MYSAAVTKRATCGVALLLLLLSGSALAGPIPLESGSVSYIGPPSGGDTHLEGTISYYVYSPGTFPYPPTDGYTPTAGEYAYVYQVHENANTLTTHYAPVSNLNVGVPGPADNLGQFTDANPPIAGPNFPANLVPADGYSYLIGGDSANWGFSTVIPEGGSSYALAYSSPYPPILGTYSLNDDGTSAGTGILGNTSLVPVPGTMPAPEPSTIVLLCLGMIASLPAMIRRWRRR